MCRRDTTDKLVRMFLDRYGLNLLSLPGRRVACGSVYVEQDGRLTAPGPLNDLIEPRITLKKPFEDDLPDLAGVWSDSVSTDVGLELLQNFLVALGAPGLVDEVRVSAKHNASRKVAFRFEKVSRESLNPISLGKALNGRRLSASNPWVRDGNRYFAVAAVVRSRSISIQGRANDDSAIELGVGVATVAEAKAKVEVAHGEDDDLVFKGRDPLAVAVELYELRWDEDRGELYFLTPKGALKLHGLEEGQVPEPVYIGTQDDVLIAPEETEQTSVPAG
jgi:hypothetical protein